MHLLLELVKSALFVERLVQLVCTLHLHLLLEHAALHLDVCTCDAGVAKTFLGNYNLAALPRHKVCLVEQVLAILPVAVCQRDERETQKTVKAHACGVQVFSDGETPFEE